MQERDAGRECAVEVEAEGLCAICNEMTHWLELNFECWLCWPVCYDTMWGQYLQSEREYWLGG